MIQSISMSPNSIVIENSTIYCYMYTASYCPPCQASKKFLFSNNFENLTEAQQINYINDKIQQSLFLSESLDRDLFKKLIENKNKNTFYSSGLNIIQKILNKDTQDFSVILINYVYKNILEKVQNFDNTKNLPQNIIDQIIYIGGVLFFLQHKIVFVFVDVQDENNENLVMNNGIKSIPTFIVCREEKKVKKTSSIQNLDDLNSFLFLFLSLIE